MTTRIEQILNQRERLLDETERRIARSLDAIEAAFFTFNNADPELYKDAERVRSLLLQAGLTDLIDSLPYDELAELEFRLAQQHQSPERRSDMVFPIAAILAARQDIFNTVNQRVLQVSSDIASNVSQSASLISLNVGSLFDIISGRFRKVKRDLATALNTSLHVSSRSVQESLTSQFQEPLYIYSGIRDSKNRAFCADVLDRNNAYTESGIQKLNKHPLLLPHVPPNVKTLCGGYNCRHMFAVVSREFAEKNGMKVKS